MRAAIPTTIFMTLLVAMSVVLAGVASALALARPDAERLDADLASIIRADYSADPDGTTLAPLDEGIIDAARQDEDNLREVPGVHIVPVFFLDDPGDGVGTPGDGVSTPGDGGSTPGDGGSTPGDGGSTPGDGGSTPGDGGSTPGDGGSTPGDGGSTPGPTPTPTPTPPPAPTPPPPAPGSLTLYLHNDPSPPAGDTASHATLPVDLTAPTASVLHNYDIDRDTFPGLLIKKGGSGAGETDPTKYQAWRSAVVATDLTIQGNVVVELWSAMKEFAQGKQGRATVYLRHFDGSSSTEIAQATRTDGDWQGGSSGWVLKSFVLGVGPYTVAAGHSLELTVIVEPSSADDMWFAYDTAAYPSRVQISTK